MQFPWIKVTTIKLRKLVIGMFVIMKSGCYCYKNECMSKMKVVAK